MSTLQNTSTVWNPLTTKEIVDSKHEKCRNITEEIYKRINITFQIKKLETQSVHSDLSDNRDHNQNYSKYESTRVPSTRSDQIDSNELSNETDLFACDKTSISSSENEKNEKPSARYNKFINNNNEEPKKPVTVYKRPRKRFRKRVKKHQSKVPNVESDASSDEALPLCRIVGLETSPKQDDVECSNGSLESVMGVPKVVLVTKDLKKNLNSPDTVSKSSKIITVVSKRQQDNSAENPDVASGNTDRQNANDDAVQVTDARKASCHLCTSKFRGERSLRRHMTLTHLDSLVDKVTQKKKKEIISA